MLAVLPRVPGAILGGNVAMSSVTSQLSVDSSSDWLHLVEKFNNRLADE